MRTVNLKIAILKVKNELLLNEERMKLLKATNEDLKAQLKELEIKESEKVKLGLVV